jgi:hypothetical protein
MVKDIDDEETVESVIKRANALTELRKKFREWLASVKRKEYYESTMLYLEDPFRKERLPDYLYKWPLTSENKEAERYGRQIKRELLEGVIRCYNLDGQRLRLAKRTKTGLRFLGRVSKNGWIKIDRRNVKEEDLDREDIVIVVDEKLEKLPKFPLEKIEFLKEDFPELFK